MAITIEATAIIFYFDDIRLSLAGCSPAAPASVLPDGGKGKEVY